MKLNHKLKNFLDNIKIDRNITQNKINDLVKSLSQIIVDEYGVDPIYATNLIKNKIKKKKDELKKP